MADNPKRVSDGFHPDGFQAGRLAVLQPKIPLPDLDSGIMVTEDPLYLGCLTNLLRAWSQSRHDLPYSFAEEVRVHAASRQPVAFYSVDIQLLSRSASAVHAPYKGEEVNDSPWPTNDLFQLLPVSTMVFPPSELNECVPLSGREKIVGCRHCSETGQVLCLNCGGAGQLLCEACGGAQRVECPQCDGAGTHIGVRGRMIQCRVCNTRGTVRCDRCERGHINCRACQDGKIVCNECKGQGKLKKSWQMHTMMSTQTFQSHFISVPWPLEIDALRGDSDQLYCRSCEWPLKKYAEMPLIDGLPADIQSRVQDLLQQGLVQERKAETSKYQITGARVRVNGTYVYAVDYSYRDHKDRVYVSGTHNRVFSGRAPIRAPGLVKRVTTLGLKLFDKIMGNEGPPLDSTYVRAVSKGYSHIADSRCLLPSVAQSIDLTLSLTDNGYRLEIPPEGIRFDIEFQTNARQELLICVKHVLGPANRNRFAQCLIATHSLSFGRIAVVEDPQTGQQFFEYLERRLYQLTLVHHFARMLRAMAMDIASLQREKHLV